LPHLHPGQGPGEEPLGVDADVLTETSSSDERVDAASPQTAPRVAEQLRALGRARYPAGGAASSRATAISRRGALARRHRAKSSSRAIARAAPAGNAAEREAEELRPADGCNGPAACPNAGERRDGFDPPQRREIGLARSRERGDRRDRRHGRDSLRRREARRPRSREAGRPEADKPRGEKARRREGEKARGREGERARRREGEKARSGLNCAACRSGSDARANCLRAEWRS
jgi:hypothetical protein